MNFVDEEHLLLADACQDRARSTGRSSTARRARTARQACDHNARVVLPCRESEAGHDRGFAALARGGNRDLKVRADALLADVVVQRSGTEPRFVLDVFIDPRSGHDPRRVIHSGEIL